MAGNKKDRKGDTSPWASEAVESAISNIAESKHLVILVGAGVSVDRGIPGWRDLITQLAVNAMSTTPKMSLKQKDRLSRALLREFDDPMATAQLLSGLKGDEWLAKEVSRIFYNSEIDQASEDYLTALSFVVAGRFLGNLETTVISTNFDDIIERDMNEKSGLSGSITLAPVYDTKTVRAAKERQEDDPSIIPIYHIHGFLAKGGQHTPIVLTLEQFASLEESDWTEVLLRGVQDADVWLSVGMSLTDLHILKHVLRRSRRDVTAQTYALLARHDRNDFRDDKDLFFYLENAVTTSYENLGVTPVIMNWYGELSLFLDEVLLNTGPSPLSSEDPAAPSPFRDRRKEWSSRVQRANRLLDNRGMRIREKRISKALHNAQVIVMDFIKVHFPGAENIKIEYWELNDDMTQLQCLASSDGLKYGAATRPTIPLRASSTWAAAQAVQANLVRVVPGDGTSRWLTFSAWPVRLWSKPHFGIPAGAVVFSSDVAAANSGLIAAESVENVLRQVVTVLTDVIHGSAPGSP